MQNDISPGFVKIHYSVVLGGSTFFDHVQTIPVFPTDEGGGVWTIGTNGGGVPLSLQTAIDQYMPVILPLFGSIVTFLHAELWSKPTPADDPQFVAFYAIGENGTGTGTTVVANMATFTYRSSEGGLGRNVLVSILAPPNEVLMPPTYGGDADYEAYADFITKPDTWVGCRDGGFAYAPIRILTKTSDAVRRKFL